MGAALGRARTAQWKVVSDGGASRCPRAGGLPHLRDSARRRRRCGSTADRGAAAHQPHRRMPAMRSSPRVSLMRSSAILAWCEVSTSVRATSSSAFTGTRSRTRAKSDGSWALTTCSRAPSRGRMGDFVSMRGSCRLMARSQCGRSNSSAS